MVLIFTKARICRGNTQVHLQLFCKSKLQSTQKGQAATQMDRSSASSEISFHGLPSKSKRPSIRKHSVVVIIAVNSISFYEIAICREIFSKYFLPVFLWTFRKFQQRIKIRSEKFQKVYKNTLAAKPYVSKVAGFYRSNHGMRSVKKNVVRKIFARFTGKGLCQRLYLNKVAFLRL